MSEPISPEEIWDYEAKTFKKKIAELKLVSTHLINAITSLGVCATCKEMYIPHEEGPFVQCACGTSEWTEDTPLLWKVKDELSKYKKEISELIEDQKILDALRAAGVDNWPGYEIAMDSLIEEEVKNDRTG